MKVFVFLPFIVFIVACGAIDTVDKLGDLSRDAQEQAEIFSVKIKADLAKAKADHEIAESKPLVITIPSITIKPPEEIAVCLTTPPELQQTQGCPKEDVVCPQTGNTPTLQSRMQRWEWSCTK